MWFNNLVTTLDLAVLLAKAELSRSDRGTFENLRVYLSQLLWLWLLWLLPILWLKGCQLTHRYGSIQKQLISQCHNNNIMHTKKCVATIYGIYELHVASSPVSPIFVQHSLPDLCSTHVEQRCVEQRSGRLGDEAKLHVHRRHYPIV